MRFKFCSECEKQGHIYKLCSVKNNAGNSLVKTIECTNIEISDDTLAEEFAKIDTDSEEPRYSSDLYMIKSDSSKSNGIVDVPPHFETIFVNNVPLKMEVDTGALISAISYKMYQKYFSNTPLDKSKLLLKSYYKQIIPAVGVIKVSINRDKLIENQLLYIIEKGVTH